MTWRRIAWVCGVLAAGSAAAAECGTPLVRVQSGDPRDLRHACEAVRRVLALLGDGHGLVLRARVEIRFLPVVEIDLRQGPVRVFGRYDPDARRADVASFGSPWLRAPRRATFGLAVDEDLHTGIIAHELAHALTRDNYRVAVPGVASDEYLAYAVQIATLRPDTLARVLAANPGVDFASLDDVTEMRHAVHPHRFGVGAYRHFAREGHGYMVEEVLSGRFLTFMPAMHTDGPEPLNEEGAPLPAPLPLRPIRTGIRPSSTSRTPPGAACARSGTRPAT